MGVVCGADRRAAAGHARRQLQGYGEYLVDALRLAETTPQACFDAIDADAGDWAAVARSHQREPLLFALMHLGNWDVLGGAYSARCGDLGVLIEPLGHSALDAAIQNDRRELGMTPLDARRDARAALRALRDNGALAVLFDRPLHSDEHGITASFFGSPCRLPQGMARLALATGARVVPLGCVRTAPGRFQFRGLVEPGFDYRRTDDRTRDVQALTQDLLDVFQPWVRRHPDQWYQFRPFFLPS